jgi:hypothetical protein
MPHWVLVVAFEGFGMERGSSLGRRLVFVWEEVSQTQQQARQAAIGMRKESRRHETTRQRHVQQTQQRHVQVATNRGSGASRRRREREAGASRPLSRRLDHRVRIV